MLWPSTSSTETSGRRGSSSSPLGPLTRSRLGSGVSTVTPPGTATGSFPMRDMAQLTFSRTSPPALILRAVRSETTPLLVERTYEPNPRSTGGISVALM